MPVEYLDPEIAGEGIHVDKWTPGAWADAPDTRHEEWQPEIEPPHINDYAAFKKHKHYGKYFKPYRYVPFPAVMYYLPLCNPKSAKAERAALIALAKAENVAFNSEDSTEGIRLAFPRSNPAERIVNSRDEVIALGRHWSPTPPVQSNHTRAQMSGKSLPIKSETQRLAETIERTAGKGAVIDPNMIGAIVAAVMAAMKPEQAAPAASLMPDAAPAAAVDAKSDADAEIERQALIELAEKEGVKIDKRWATPKIKEALGL